MTRNPPLRGHRPQLRSTRSRWCRNGPILRRTVARRRSTPMLPGTTAYSAMSPVCSAAPLPALECALFVVRPSKAMDRGSPAPFRSSIMCFGCAPQKKSGVCSFSEGHPCTLQGTTFYVSAGMLVCGKCVGKSKEAGASAGLLTTCWPGINQGYSLVVDRGASVPLTTDPEATLSGLNQHVVALERLPNGDWQAMSAAGMLRALEHGRLLRGSWTPPTLGQVFGQFRRQADPAGRVVWPTSSGPANVGGSPEVRPLSTFFGPMHPMEPRMDTAEGFAVINWEADSREGADHGSRRGAKRSRRVEQARLSTVDDPLEHAGWGWPPTLGGWPRILAWGLDGAPARAVDWDLPLVLDAGLVGVSGWLEEQAARKRVDGACDGTAADSAAEAACDSMALALDRVVRESLNRGSSVVAVVRILWRERRKGQPTRSPLRRYCAWFPLRSFYLAEVESDERLSRMAHEVRGVATAWCLNTLSVRDGLGGSLVSSEVPELTLSYHVDANDAMRSGAPPARSFGSLQLLASGDWVSGRVLCARSHVWCGGRA